MILKCLKPMHKKLLLNKTLSFLLNVQLFYLMYSKFFCALYLCNLLLFHKPFACNMVFFILYTTLLACDDFNRLKQFYYLLKV